jgi:hypothetical protein
MMRRIPLAAAAAPALIACLACAFMALALGLGQSPAILERAAFAGFNSDQYFHGQLVGLAMAVLVVIAAARFLPRQRWAAPAAALLLAALTTIAVLWSMEQTTGTSHLLGLAALVSVRFAEPAALVFGVAATLESRLTGARSAALFGMVTVAALLVDELAEAAASKLNPDFVLHAGGAISACAVAAAFAAAALVAALAGQDRTPPARASVSATVVSAVSEIWRTRRTRLVAAAFLIQACLISALATLGTNVALRLSFDAYRRVVWLEPAALAVGLFAGAWLADRRRWSPAGPAAVAAWGVGAGVLLFLFALNDDNPQQSLVVLYLAIAACSLAWAPAVVTVADGAAAQNRGAGLAVLLMSANQVGVIGLPALLAAIAIKLAGGADWTLTAGVWGRTDASAVAWRHVLPIRIKLDLGDADAAAHALRTGGLFLALLLVVPVVLYRLAGQAQETASLTPSSDEPPDCPSCGSENSAGNKFCQACGRRLPTGAAAAAVKDSRRFPALLAGICLASAGAAAAIVADAQGVFQKRWTPAIAWQAPDEAGEAIKSCKDWSCAYDVLAKYKAPQETVKFDEALQRQAPRDTLGYPVAMNGKGRVKAVQFFEPGLGMEGVSEFIFVNGSKDFVRPTDNVESAADADVDFQNFKLQYPQVMIWPEQVFHKETVLPDGSQSFEFQQSLLNGCHACELLGVLDVSYNFDKRGHYTGVTIAGVEADKNAPYAALLGRLRSDTQFFQTFSQLQPDGRTATSQLQSILQEKDHCRLGVETSGNTFQGGYFTLDNAFRMKDVAIETAPMLAQAGALVPTPPNGLAIACKTSPTCISQDYSDQRGHAGPVPYVTFNVPMQNVDQTIRDFEALQAMCG